MVGLDTVLGEFNADIERAESLLQLIKSFRDFGASQPPANAGQPTDDWPAATLLHQASKPIRTHLPILSASLELYIVGRFEYGIRQVVEVVADDFAARASKYVELPEAIRSELRKQTLEVAQSPKRYGYDDAQVDVLLSNLVGNFGSQHSPLSISSAVLSITDSNMREKMLSDLLKRVGMTEFWQNVGKQASMKLVLAKNSDQETAAEAKAKLNAIMDERNQIAHPTGNTNFPDTDHVLGVAKFLKALSATTVDLAKVHLNTHVVT